MINFAEVNLQKPREEKLSLAAELQQTALKSIAEQAQLAAEKRAEIAKQQEEDAANEVLKAYNSMDKSMMEVVDEHIERVRRSSERNNELHRKLALRKEIEKRDQLRQDNFDEAAARAETQRTFLHIKKAESNG